MVEAIPKTHTALNSLSTGMTVLYTIMTRIFGDSLRNKTCPGLVLYPFFIFPILFRLSDIFLKRVFRVSLY
jgi:hypothetical protein